VLRLEYHNQGDGLMKDRVVPPEEIEEKYIAFCKDLGAEGENREEIDRYLQDHNIVVEKKEDMRLIWFEQIVNNKVKYYSEPIEKFVSEPDKEIKFYIKSNVPLGRMLHLPESALPLYHFNQKRKNKIPLIEIRRKDMESHIRSYQMHIDWSFDYSVFGYIIFDGTTIRYPRYIKDCTLVYEGDSEQSRESYNDTDLLKKLLSNKDMYVWYEFGDEWFIVRKSKKREYQYLADVKTQEIKLAKIEGDKIVLEDIIKDELTLKVEAEIDNCLKVSKGVTKPYIRYGGRCFEVVENENIPVPVKKHEFSLFPKSDYRTQCFYKKVDTDLTYEEIEKVVKDGNKYKWFEHQGKLYITRTFGWSEMRVIVGDVIPDFLDGVECEFKYNNSPNVMMIKFIESGVWDGDIIMQKYECAQQIIDNLARELIYYKVLEKNDGNSNKYKIIEHREDLVLMIQCLEHALKL